MKNKLTSIVFSFEHYTVFWLLEGEKEVGIKKYDYYTVWVANPSFGTWKTTLSPNKTNSIDFLNKFIKTQNHENNI